MKLHRFYVPPETIDREHVTFSQAQLHQLQRVLRIKAGGRVRVFDGVQPFDLVVDLSGRVLDRCPHAPEPRTRLVAYPALLQRDKFETVLQKLTELGVRAIVPVLTARGLVREPPDERQMSRWQSIIREAAEQCGRGTLPPLGAAMHFKEALSAAVADGVTIFAYEEEQRMSLREALRRQARTETVSIFVGPEGGFTPEEAQHAATAGASLITLGPRILRTETASPVLAALVLYECGDLSSDQEP